LDAARLALHMPPINPQAITSAQAFMARIAKIDVLLSMLQSGTTGVTASDKRYSISAIGRAANRSP